MSNEEESLLALLWESLGNGQRSNAPIFVNFNSFNAPVGQHNDHVDTVNFSMDKDGASVSSTSGGRARASFSPK